VRDAFNDTGAGEADLRVKTGTGSGGDVLVDVAEGVEGDDVVVAATLDVDASAVSLLDDSAGDGVLNSTGFTRGVAWILVISFARSQ